MSSPTTAARSRLTEKLGTERTILAVVLASAVVTYGGVSVFVAVRTNNHSAEWVDRFRNIVTSFPEVVDFFRLSGDVVNGPSRHLVPA